MPILQNSLLKATKKQNLLLYCEIRTSDINFNTKVEILLERCIMIKIAICDDEQNSRAYLKQLVLRQRILGEDALDYEIAEFSSGTELLNASEEFDILFLDIDLKEELTGMELARIIRNCSKEKQPIIIFISGYKEYVFDAFDVDAFHYLLKPINNEKFTYVFEKAYRQRTNYAEQKIKKVQLKSGTLNKVVSIDELFFVESQDHKVMLHTNQSVFEYYAKISDLEMQLEEEFFRIHKGYLLNLAYIDHYTKTEVVLKNGERLPISKYKYADFVKAYLRFMT